MSTRKKARRPSLKGSLNPSKRHRDRVNVELDNLAKLLPFAPEVIAKLDKLSVLRLSASYLRTKNFFKGLNVGSKLNTAESSTLDEFEKTGAISDLLLEALDGFLMVLTQDGEVFYASETISEFLGVSQASVIHQDFMRFVHVDDQHTLENNLKLVPSPPEQKIREITDDDVETNDNEENENGKEVNKERSFVCRLKCVLNTNAGFFKPFKCHGRLREVDVPDASCPQLALFLICSPLEMTSSIVEVRMKSVLFCTKNKLDLTFVDIDQKGRQIVGYTKKDIMAQSSYCMMHYDDIPVLRIMHQDLITTGKCEGIFRWLNKQNKWQWLSGSGQVIFKNNRPDFVLTTNKPLTDEEGDEEIRRRERELGIIPTSPASLLSHLQIATPSPPPSTTPVGSPSDLQQPHLPQYAPGPNVSPSLANPGLPTTSCTSDPFPPEDLPEFLSWDSRASLSDLDTIGKGDLVDGLLELDVSDLAIDPLDESNTVPLTHASDSSYPPPEIVSNPPMSQPGAWMARDQRMTSQYPPGQRQPVSSSGMGTSTYSVYGPPRVPATGAMPPSGVGSTGTISPQGVAPGIGISRIVSPQGVAPGIGTSRIVSPQSLSPGIGTSRIVSPQGVAPGISNAEIVSPQVAPPGIVSPQGIPPGIAPPRNIQRNGISANGLFMNAGDPSGYQATMSLSQPLPPRGNVNSSQAGLLKVQTQPMSNRSYVKTEQVRSAGYYCSSSNIDPALPGGLTNGPLFPGDSTPSNVYRYQNKLNHGGLSQWTTAPPSPYSSGSSSTSSYDALHMQFSPTEVLTSPFASPRDSNDYNYGNSPNSVPLPRQPYSNNGQRSFTRPPPNFPQPYVDIPEIAPIGMVEELVPGMHHTSPLGSRTTAGLTHM